LWTDLLILFRTAYVIMVKPIPPSFAALDKYVTTLVQGTSSMADEGLSKQGGLEENERATVATEEM